jgi:hypothetical protein
LPWLTSSHASLGLCFPAAMTTDRQPCNRASTFPALRPLKFPHRSLHRSSKDERTVTTACPQPGTENGLQRPTDLEGQTRAQLIMARRADLHPKAEYICADLSSRPNFPLQSCGGPYILVTDISQSNDNTSRWQPAARSRRGRRLRLIKLDQIAAGVRDDREPHSARVERLRYEDYALFAQAMASASRSST